MVHVSLGRRECGTFQNAIEQEWLVANVIGGFASGTICDTKTSRNSNESIVWLVERDVGGSRKAPISIYIYSRNAVI